jgi:hypothetical protein
LDFANSRQLDPRITFTRSTTATYYDGVTTAKAEENLFTYSQEFDNAAWTKALVTITANATTAPDGTSTADLAVANTTNGDHSVIQSFTFPANTTLTISCYMKAAGYDYGVIRHYSDGNGDVWASFNLSTGAVDSNSSGVTASITSVGSSWYRCVMTKTYSSATSGNSYGIRVANAGGIGTPFAGNGTSGIYIWGAQLEQRSSATAYTATTTQAITNYIPKLLTAGANQPRFDHNPTTGESLGFLIEEQRTNSVTNSDMQAGWGIPNAGYTYADKVIAPDGSLISSINKNSTYQLIRQGSVFNPAVSATYTVSFWAKAISGSNPTVSFDLGDLTGSGTAITTTWTRYSFTQAVTAGATPHSFLDITLPDNVTIALWGVQVETGAFATSYIPTTSASVTRTADAASMTGTNLSSWYNNSAGTFYVESQNEYNVTNFAGTGFETYSGFQTNMFFISAKRDGDYARGVTYMSPSGFDLVSLAYANTSATTFYKYAGAMSKTALSTAIMGIGATKTINLGVPPMPTVFAIGSNAYAYNYFVGHIKKLAYYPVGLTVGQLQALTS